MNLLLCILIAWALMAAVMATLWLIQKRRGNAGIVDIAWSFGTGACGAWFALMATGDPSRRWLVGALAGVWGLRLGLHLLHRVMSEEEDGRYRKLREQWGADAQRKLFLFFQIQAAWAVMFALPMLVAASNPEPGLRWHDWLGLTFWIVSIAGESVADRQLSAFRRDQANRGRVCNVGLWRYSRHPNYFFEWLHWWAYVFISVGSAWWWATIPGPLVMLLFLLKVTGIPMTEARALVSRGEAYRRYQRTTSAFFPWPPKKDDGSS